MNKRGANVRKPKCSLFGNPIRPEPLDDTNEA